MIELAAAIASALWLGILTSISPCPLASNVAALSYMGRHAESPARVLLSGVVYSLGRALTYVLVGALVVASILSVPSVSFFLQEQMNLVIGPLLVLIGVGILGRIPIRLPWAGFGDGLRQRVARRGLLGAGGLGFLFALSFCPVSAGLFFGGLIPLAMSARSPIVLPAAYGIGTGLPVVVFAVLIAFGARSVSKAFNALQGVERLARIVTGVIFVGAGGYLFLTHIRSATP
ncbi:MAG: aromatic aminobenezylarsenical efflux permease ArsG family transporter [Acidobacteriota bacterium]